MQQLYDTALWLIIDPWLNQPKPCPPDTDIIHAHYSTKIDQYFKGWKVQNKLVLLDDEDEISPQFNNYPRMSGHTFLKNKVWQDYTHLVYTGFHHGQCIVYRPWGVKHMSQHITCSVVRHLVCVYPGSEWPGEDKITQQYAKLI